MFGDSHTTPTSGAKGDVYDSIGIGDGWPVPDETLEQGPYPINDRQTTGKANRMANYLILRYDSGEIITEDEIREAIRRVGNDTEYYYDQYTRRVVDRLVQCGYRYYPGHGYWPPKGRKLQIDHKRRQEVHTLKELIAAIEKEREQMDGVWHHTGVPVSLIERWAEQLDICEGDFQDEIERLWLLGEVYEPREDHLRTT